MAIGSFPLLAGLALYIIALVAPTGQQRRPYA
jgi:hypothetical protein